MTTRLPWARLIQGHPTRNVLYVVYDHGVQTNEVRPVVRQMSALRGIQARAVMAAMDDPSAPKVAVIELTIQESADVEAAMSLLRRLTRPVLPVAIRLIKVELLICRCNYQSTRLAALLFYMGLGPDDHEVFRQRYVAGMRGLPVAVLFSAEPQPPYRLLTDGIEGVLAGIGARATMVDIAPRRDTRPCTHT